MKTCQLNFDQESLSINFFPHIFRSKKKKLKGNNNKTFSEC